MDKETKPQSTTPEISKDAESKQSIPVICELGRSEEGTNRKPHGIHLNPKFFGSANESISFRAFPPGQNRPPRFHCGPHFPPRFVYDQHLPPRCGFGPNSTPRFGPPCPPPRFGSDPRGYHSSIQSGPFNQHHFTPYPRFRPNFQRFDGPGNRFPFSPSRFPCAPPFGWNENVGIPNANFQQNLMGPNQPFMRGPYNFTGQYDTNTNHYLQHPEHHSWTNNTHFFYPHPEDPYPCPPIHDIYQSSGDNYHKEDIGDPCLSPNGRKRYNSRSRSRSADSRRQKRFSTSSGSSISSYHRRSRSYSLSSGSNRSNHGKSEENSIWDSDEERNSDSDLDLSKPMDTLINTVSDSKLLLKNALKCLGSTKVRTMIPLEFSQLSRKKLFRMCHKLLEETDNEKLVSVMEGSLQRTTATVVKNGELSPKTFTDQPIQTSSSETDTDVDNSTVQRRIIIKRKKSKEKRKQRKRSRISQSDAESAESSDDESTNSSKSSSSIKDNLPFPCKPGTSSSSTTQQSLLELIQIEYKTKAINVMLKHLGVANEINSMVSNVLQTNGISAVQSLLSQDILESGVNLATKDSGAAGILIHRQAPADANDNVEQVLQAIAKTESDADDATVTSVNEATSEDSVDGKMIAATDRTSSIGLSGAENDDGDSKGTTFDFEHQNVVLEEKELLKEVDDDVLDLQINANEELDLLR